MCVEEVFFFFFFLMYNDMFGIPSAVTFLLVIRNRARADSSGSPPVEPFNS